MKKNYHFIGIGGVGMSGIARILCSRNMQVSGSDLAANVMTENLKKEGVSIFIGHKASNISKDMTVVYSTDIKENNPEFQAAKALQCSMLHRSELLQILMENSLSLAVAGTHGKTTTSSLLAWVLEQGDLSPSYAIGGVIPQLKTNSKHGQGKYFVAEACESDGTLLNYSPYGVIVTNIDLDHMDFYRTEEALLDTFKLFISKVSSHEHLFWCGDDKRLQQIQPPGISYGFSENCLLRASNFVQWGWAFFFDVSFNGKVYSQVEVSLAGRHNALNALAVFGLALSLNVDETSVRKALASFGGVLRRLEKKGEEQGILFLDDYAHHPTELRATLKAIRQVIGERRLVVGYQPHRYTRSKALMGTYQGVFQDVDHLIVTDIYSAGETPIEGVSHKTVIDEIRLDLKESCQHVKRAELSSFLNTFLRPHDVFVSLGAGDITKVSAEVLAEFKLKAPQKLKVGLVSGGRSVEHEVSLKSAKSILNLLRSDYYDVEQFGIDREGRWVKEICIEKRGLQESLDQSGTKMTSDIMQSLLGCDIIFPVLHGSYGEDGTIQGLFEMLGVAYVGCDHRSAAICMDKVLTKKLVIDAGIATSDFVSFSRYEWEHDQILIQKHIIERLTFPMFVKPTHLGSSVGIHRVTDKESLNLAIKNAFSFDTHILVENSIIGRELEFSVLGNDQIVAFPPGEILTGGKVYDYQAKYSKDGTRTTDLAEVSTDQLREGLALVKKAYRATLCRGMARIDTFLDQSGKFWLNEINPIPGFTKASLFPRMCAVNGLKGTDLVDRLIVLGLERKRLQDRVEVKPDDCCSEITQHLDEENSL